MNPYAIEVRDLDGNIGTLAPYEGRVLLIVNVASQCGFTPQYAGLEALYRQFHVRGFEVLGFPCNQFGHQEPGDAAEIKNFCSLNYDVSFPLFAKIEVNGPNTHPLYQYLKQEHPGVLGTEAIKWNFTKFLLDGHGKVVQRYAPTEKPEDLAGDIEALLSKPTPYNLRDNAAEGRFELDVTGGTAFITYWLRGNVVIMLHAEVPRELRGQGVGARLVKEALELVRSRNQTVNPRCSFVATYIHRHPEFRSLVAQQ
jgi:glutathione peroxidase